MVFAAFYFSFPATRSKEIFFFNFGSTSWKIHRFFFFLFFFFPLLSFAKSLRIYFRNELSNYTFTMSSKGLFGIKERLVLLAIVQKKKTGFRNRIKRKIKFILLCWFQLERIKKKKKKKMEKDIMQRWFERIRGDSVAIFIYGQSLYFCFLRVKFYIDSQF